MLYKGMTVTLFMIAVLIVAVACLGSNGDDSGKVNPVLHDSDGNAVQNIQQIEFSLAGTFDGSETPVGKFTSLSAVAAGRDNVFVADRDYSFVYIFGRDGKLEKPIGCGFRVEDYVLDDESMLDSYSHAEYELAPELANEIALHRFFRPEDLEITAGHLYVLSSFMANLSSMNPLGPCIFEFTLEGQYYEERKISQVIFPMRLSVAPTMLITASDAVVNDVAIYIADGVNSYINNEKGVSGRSYYLNEVKMKDNPEELSAYRAEHSNRGLGKEQYSGISGVASYVPETDEGLMDEWAKVLVCDTGNDRVKILDFNGRILRIINGSALGVNGFLQPVDVEVDTDGNIFILDGDAQRVVVLDKYFRFLCGFGSGDIVEGQAISVDPMGDVWIADKGKAMILHFERH